MNTLFLQMRMLAVCGMLLWCFAQSSSLLATEPAESIIAKSNFTGGVAVHVHGADASLLQSIAQQCPAMLGHLLVVQEKDACQAREAIVAAGLHGKLTVGQWASGTLPATPEVLPFIDNFVNLLIIDGGIAVSHEEIDRVLAPEGMALIGAEKIIKPRPITMDDWTHQLYDATGNAVSKDKALRPPLAHLQWVGGPRWSRHHDKMSSVSPHWLRPVCRSGHCSLRPTISV